MHAVVVQVKFDPARAEEALDVLHQAVIPMSKMAKGFTGGTWLRSPDDTHGLSVEIFATEEDAKAFAAGVQTPPGSAASIDTIEIMEVTGTA